MKIFEWIGKSFLVAMVFIVASIGAAVLLAGGCLLADTVGSALMGLGVLLIVCLVLGAKWTWGKDSTF